MSPAVVQIGVSIPVPPPFGPALQQARVGFGDPLADAIPAHVTVVGPTTVPVGDLPGVIAHLESGAARFGPFEVHLRGTGTFRPVSDVVFVQVVRGISECERLEAAMRSGPLAQDRRFHYHPHVTVAHDVPAAALDRAFEELAGFEAAFPVGAVTLYEHGADDVWRPVREIPLGPAADATAPGGAW